jgi:hypothetical protein
MRKDVAWSDFGILVTIGILVAVRLIWGQVQPELIIPIAILLGALLGWRERGQ